MNTRIRYGAASVLGIASLAFSQLAWSLGLGDAKVQSFLDQPLEIQIELITREGDNLDAFTAGLASAADYELIGASRNDISVPLSFSIEGSPGESSILVRSQLPVKSPVVRLIVEVNSASGRMLREYTLFLDPATFSQPAPAPKVESAASTNRSTTTQPVTPAPREAAADAPESSRTTTSQQTSFSGSGEYGPVQSGDTLWRIAKNWSEGSGASINQAMVAIQRNNPGAFSKGNINLLQRGAILRMPEIAEVTSIPVSEANNEVRDQTAAFRMRRDVTSASTPLLVDENTAPQAVRPAPTPEPEAEPAIEPEEEVALESAAEATSEQLTKAAEELAADESGEFGADENLPLDFEPQLELVPPSEESELEGTAGLEESDAEMDASDSARDLREELARKEEELINQQQQNAYLEQRLKELESQVAESNEGTVTDKNLASMEQRLQQERLAAQAEDEDKPWYSGLVLLWVGLLVIVAALVGWFVSRRGAVNEFASSNEALRDIQTEAEDVLRVLDADSSEKPAEETVEQAVVDTDPVIEPETEESDETVIAPVSKKEKKKFGHSDDEAELLDEESADPEIQLDLARAYISMGDKEAARVILEEVVANGSDAQKAEATKMKNLL